MITQKIFRQKYILLSLIALFTLLGCFKDKGSYEYSPINEFTISGLPTEKLIKYQNADSLIVLPVISGSLGESSKGYSYTWEAVSKVKAGNLQTSSYHIGNEKKLRYFVELPEDEYDIYIGVKDLQTGVTWKNKFSIRVTTKVDEGWLVLSEEDNYARLDMISLSGSEELVVRDLIKDNPKFFGPRRLKSVYDMFFSTSDPRYYVLTEAGAYKLNKKTFEYDEANELRYEMMEYPAGFAPGLRTAGMGWEMIISNKAVYGGTTFGAPVLFGLPINYMSDTKNVLFEVAEAIGTNVSYSAYQPVIILYDTSNKRFVRTNPSLTNCIALPNLANPIFSWETGYDFVYMTSTPYDNGSVYAILEDPTTKDRYMYVMQVGSSVTQRKQLKLDIPNISAATSFAMHPSLPWLYYAVDNKVYLYDLENNHVNLIHLDGEKITMIKFNIFVGLNAKPNIQGQLIVGSTTNDSGLNGIVRTYDVPKVFGSPVEVLTEQRGFGKPIDVTYLEK